ncbi:MAG: hypothetical protein ACRDCN_14415, partial [Tannerellaceae bacterium]
KKEDVITDTVRITKIELTSILNKARYEFAINDGYTNVEGINCITESNDITNFSIEPNQIVAEKKTLLLPADHALFMINQSLTSENKLIITYNKGSETVKTIEADLSAVTPDKLWDFSKAYHYSILIKEDKVTITAKITYWIGQKVDVAVPGTYLNVSQLSYSFTQGTAGDIYYSTDGSPVNVTCDKNITLSHDETEKKFTFPTSAEIGDYIATITAGGLSRKVQVTVVEPEPEEPPYIQIGNLLWATGNLVADGPNGCKVGQPQDGGLYFQWGSLIGWTGGANGDGTGKPTSSSTAAVKVKPTGYNSSPIWTNCPKGSMIVSPSQGTGDPCEHYLGNEWRLPTSIEFKTLFENKDLPIYWPNISSWSTQGTFAYESESYAKHTSELLLRASGRRSNSNGVLMSDFSGHGRYGAYWSSTKYTNTTDSYILSFVSSSASPGNYMVYAYGHPIRCVKPVGTTPEPEDPDFIVEEGVAAPRIFVQGTGDNAKLMLTKKPTNYGAYFQFMGITAWEYDESVNYKPIANTTIGTSGWTSSSAHNVTSLRAGKGDPCRLVGYTQKQVQDMLGANIVPDNKKWKTPESNLGIATDNRTNWKVQDGINGHYLNTATPQSDFLPAAGLAWSGGTLGQQGSVGAYWTQESPHPNQGSPLTVQSGGFNINNQQHHSLRMSVRCVRQ